VNFVMGVPGADDIMLGYQSITRRKCQISMIET
jgi:ethanolamine ammonia-lyase large subunit